MRSIPGRGIRVSCPQYPSGIRAIDKKSPIPIIRAKVGINVLGPMLIDGGTALEPRDRVALSVLVIRRGQVVSPDQIADAIWGDSPPASWQKQVQICMSRLRKSLGADRIETTTSGYRISSGRTELDAVAFEELIGRSRDFATFGEPDRAAASYARALSLWRGRPYEDLDGWPPGRIEVERLEELRRSAQEEWIEARLEAGDHRAVVVEAGSLVREEPLRERRWHSLALAQYRSGRQAEALRSLAAAREMLREELGVDPGRDLAELEDAILRQDESLTAPSPPPALSDACPYKGLVSYDTDDADAFFGRDDEIALCLERLASHPVLVLAGPSGSGKSSLARAGLAPRLGKEGRSVAVFVPGRDPEEAMTAAIASSKDSSILMVDQFEEIYSLEVPEEKVTTFCNRLADYATSVAPLIITIRSDFLGGLSSAPTLSRLAESGIHLVAPLSGPQLRVAIEQPAIGAGLRLEPGLVELLERDTEGEPGSLPLLSHALAETWRRRDGQTLTVEGYRSSGGIREAVAHSADRLYDSLDAQQREVLRSLLLRMVTPSIDGPPVPYRIPAQIISGHPDRDRVVRLLVRARLITAEEDAYELAHEALARAWPRLQGWLEDDAEGQRIMRHLAARAADWDSLGRPGSELYRGARLELTLEWVERTNPDLTDIEQEFLRLSTALRDSELALSTRHNRRLRGLLAAVAALLLVAVAAGSLAAAGRNDARLEALVNQSLSLRKTDRAAAALLAVEAYRRDPESTLAWSALLGTFTGSPGFLGYTYLDGATGLSGAVVPGTGQAVVALDGHDLRLVDIESGEVSDPFLDEDALAGWASRIAVSADGRYVAQYSTRETTGPCFSIESLQANDDAGCAALFVYELASGLRVAGPIVPPFGLGWVGINADGSLVAVSGGLNGDSAIYRTDGGALIGTVDGLPDGQGRVGASDPPFGAAGIAFGPEDRFYVGSSAGPVRMVDAETASVVATWDAPPWSSNVDLEVTDDGHVVAVGTEAMVSIDGATGAKDWVADLRDGRHPEPCPFFAVNSVRDEAYCGDFFGAVVARSLTTGSITGTRFDSQIGAVRDLGILSDGDELVAFGQSVPAFAQWRTDGPGLITRPVAEGHVAMDGYDPSGEFLVVARREPTASIDFDFNDFAVWHPESDTALGRVPGETLGMGWFGSTTLTGYSPDEDRIIYVDARTFERIDGLEVDPAMTNRAWMSAGGELDFIGYPGLEIRTADAETRQRIEPTIPIRGFPSSVSATRDGALIVITQWVDGDAVTTVHDGITGDQLGDELRGPWTTSVSLDGTLVGAENGAVTQYDLSTLQPLYSFSAAGGEVNSLQFSTDGKLLLATSNDQTVSLYDVDNHKRIGDPIPAFSPFIFPGFLRPDGKAIAVNQRDGLLIWDIDPAHLGEAACVLAGRNLTEPEWHTYMGGFGSYRPTCEEYA